MESPVVVDKPPEYHGNNDRGFPFEEEEGSGAWSELAARHPDIAARLRQRPATWARKRRPSSQDATDDFGDTFSGFDRFPFDDIPPEFRDHFPSHWNRRFSREEPPPEPGPHHQPQPPSPPSPHHQTAATQTEQEPEQSAPEQTLPQYGLRNTVDLGQKSPVEPSVDAEERGQRSMSAPPAAPRPHADMSSPGREQPAHEPAHVRHIPIFVEGRDEPVINKNVDHGKHFSESKPAHAPPPHVDRDQYFADDAPGFHHPPNFTRAFGTPFTKNFRQGPQPFTQQKAYPQSAFARGPSPQRSQSPKPPPPHEEHFAKVPVHHEPPHTEPARAQQKPAPPRQPSPQSQPPEPPRQHTPPRAPGPHDPITQILSIQTDVLNLMTEVENFKGTKGDKRYMFLDEMLTRNLIKLDNIETEGKENIRQARKEAIRCIQKCIAVLEAKADSQGAAGTRDVTMEPAENGHVENVDMKEPSKEEETRDTQPERIDEHQPKEEAKVEREATPKPQETQPEQPAATPAATTEPAAADTRPEEPEPETTLDEQTKQVENKPSPKKKVGKKRDKSKDKAQDSNTEASKDSDKVESGDTAIQVDDKGDKAMEVDGGASQ